MILNTMSRCIHRDEHCDRLEASVVAPPRFIEVCDEAEDPACWPCSHCLGSWRRAS